MKTYTIIPERLSKIAALTLATGSHSNPDNGMCVMEAVAFVAGEVHSDSPQCACPVISSFMRAWNDSMNTTDRKLLKPYIEKLVGTRSTVDVEQRRGLMAASWYLTVFTPTWLELAGLSDHAEALRTATVTSWGDVKSLECRLSAAESAAESAAWSAARSAAWSAAESAAWSAARSAARSAAWSAAESAAWSAARSAAWSAARSAAWSAAESAAESAAWSAAESAAWSAARSAARSAAWSAAESALESTVERLQASAFDLLNEMIAVRS